MRLLIDNIYKVILLSSLILGISCADISWFNSFDEAKKAARKEKKPVFVLYSDSDSGCEKRVKQLIEDDSIKIDLFSFVCVKLVDKGKDKMFNDYPLIQFFSPSGDELLLQRITGSKPNNIVRFNMRSVLKTFTFNDSKIPFVDVSSKIISKEKKEINFKCELQEDGIVIIKIKDFNGRIIKSIVSETKKTGSFNVGWNGTDNYNAEVPNGRFIVVFELGSLKDEIEVKVEK